MPIKNTPAPSWLVKLVETMDSPKPVQEAEYSGQDAIDEILLYIMNDYATYQDLQKRLKSLAVAAVTKYSFNKTKILQEYDRGVLRGPFRTVIYNAVQNYKQEFGRNSISMPEALRGKAVLELIGQCREDFEEALNVALGPQQA